MGPSSGAGPWLCGCQPHAERVNGCQVLACEQPRLDGPDGPLPWFATCPSIAWPSICSQPLHVSILCRHSSSGASCPDGLDSGNLNFFVVSEPRSFTFDSIGLPQVLLQTLAQPALGLRIATYTPSLAVVSLCSQLGDWGDASQPGQGKVGAEQIPETCTAPLHLNCQPVQSQLKHPIHAPNTTTRGPCQGAGPPQEVPEPACLRARICPQVARLMGSLASCFKPEFVVSTGDNFVSRQSWWKTCLRIPDPAWASQPRHCTNRKCSPCECE